MDQRRDDLVDEFVLRRALRLDPDERSVRFDPDAIAALARPRLRSGTVVAMIVLAAVVAAVATTFWWHAFTAGPAFAGAAIAVLLDGVTVAASALYPALEAFEDPAVPLSLLAALAIAIVYETGTRREHAHAEAS